MSEPEGLSDSELAAAWGDVDGAEAAPARVLNQNEIDDLMGFDDLPDAGEQQSGLQKVVNAGLISSSERSRLAATALMRRRMVSLNSRFLAIASLLDRRVGCATRNASSLAIARSTLGALIGR